MRGCGSMTFDGCSGAMSGRGSTTAYVDHTGPLSWLQRAWAAVLYAAPAALCLESALTDEGAVIHVAVSRDRGVLAEPHGVRIHHLAHLQERVLWHVGPPRL